MFPNKSLASCVLVSAAKVVESRISVNESLPLNEAGQVETKGGGCWVRGIKGRLFVEFVLWVIILISLLLSFKYVN